MAGTAPEHGVSWYPSKVDWWLALVLASLPVAVIVVWVGLIASGSREDVWVAVVTTVAIPALLVGLVFPMRYGLGDSALIVRFGLVRQRVRFVDIVGVEPTREPLAGPALSLDRLRVRYGPGAMSYVLISPANRHAFLDELASKAGMVRDGDSLTRT